jgi:predicted esterase
VYHEDTQRTGTLPTPPTSRYASDGMRAYSLLLIAACATHAAPRRADDVSQPARPMTRNAAPLTAGASAVADPPAVASTLVELELEGREPVVVSTPAVAGRRPVLVATHGAGGRATPHCLMWRAIVAARGFVVCPQGRPMYPRQPREQQGYFYDGHIELGLEVEQALDALEARYRDDVDLGAPIYAGYSQGASMGAMMLPTHRAKFARVALVEGGFGQAREWNIAAAQRLEKNGGQRILLLCGRLTCVEHGRTTVAYMNRAGLTTKLIHAEGAGHTYGGAVERELTNAFAWLVEGDPRW